MTNIFGTTVKNSSRRDFCTTDHTDRLEQWFPTWGTGNPKGTDQDI